MQSGDATIDIPLHDMQSNDDRSNSTAPFASNAGGPIKQEAMAERERPHMFHGRRVKRDHAPGETSKVGYDGEEDTLNKMGKLYNKITGFSTLTRYLVYVTPLAACIAVPIIVGATSAPHAKIGDVRIVWFFTWIEIGSWHPLATTCQTIIANNKMQSGSVCGAPSWLFTISPMSSNFLRVLSVQVHASMP